MTQIPSEGTQVPDDVTIGTSYLYTKNIKNNSKKDARCDELESERGNVVEIKKNISSALDEEKETARFLSKRKSVSHDEKLIYEIFSEEKKKKFGYDSGPPNAYDLKQARVLIRKSSVEKCISMVRYVVGDWENAKKKIKGGNELPEFPRFSDITAWWNAEIWIVEAEKWEKSLKKEKQNQLQAW